MGLGGPFRGRYDSKQEKILVILVLGVQKRDLVVGNYKRVAMTDFRLALPGQALLLAFRVPFAQKFWHVMFQILEETLQE